MSQAPATTASDPGTGDRRLPVLLAMAMFVLVVDTSIMNVSISAVISDLGTTVSAIQSAIALEALVSAAFILIGSKIGDLFGRKRAYVLGLIAYAIGALATAFAQSVTAIIIFWAIVGGLGDGPEDMMIKSALGHGHRRAPIASRSPVGTLPQPKRSPILLPIRMNAAETSASRAMRGLDRTSPAWCRESLTTAEIDTFMIEVCPPRAARTSPWPTGTGSRRSPGTGSEAVVG